MKQQAFEALDAAITVVDNEDGTFAVAIQLKGPSGSDLPYSAAVFAYLAKDAAGATLAVDGTDTTEFVIGTDGLFVELATDISGFLVSEADGDIDVVITVATTKSAYLVLVMPNGRLVISDLMTYTA